MWRHRNRCSGCSFFFFFFNDTATTEIYTLSLHDALPIYRRPPSRIRTSTASTAPISAASTRRPSIDRKSTRLNSSHSQISYAVFCLKKDNILVVGVRAEDDRLRKTRTLLILRTVNNYRPY